MIESSAWRDEAVVRFTNEVIFDVMAEMEVGQTSRDIELIREGEHLVIDYVYRAFGHQVAIKLLEAVPDNLDPDWFNWAHYLQEAGTTLMLLTDSDEERYDPDQARAAIRVILEGDANDPDLNDRHRACLWSLHRGGIFAFQREA